MAARPRSLLLVVAVSVMALACASANVRDTPSLAGGQGIVVTNIVSNSGDYTVSIIDKTNLVVPSATLKVLPGENFRVIALPAGNYSWRGIYLNEGNFVEFREWLDFTVNAGEINYVGDLIIDIDRARKTGRLSVRDDGAGAEQRMRHEYPKLYGTYRFTKNITVDRLIHVK
jgi:hypothetical protein